MEVCMNTPNKLTVLRIAMTPIFLFFLLAAVIPPNALLAAAVFAMASITDAVDGKLARLTVFILPQMVAIITIMLLEELKVLLPTAGVQATVTVVDTVLISIATLATVISGVQYMWQYREHINTTK